MRCTGPRCHDLLQASPATGRHAGLLVQRCQRPRASFDSFKCAVEQCRAVLGKLTAFCCASCAGGGASWARPSTPYRQLTLALQQFWMRLRQFHLPLGPYSRAQQPLALRPLRPGGLACLTASCT